MGSGRAHGAWSCIVISAKVPAVVLKGDNGPTWFPTWSPSWSLFSESKRTPDARNCNPPLLQPAYQHSVGARCFCGRAAFLPSKFRELTRMLSILASSLALSPGAPKLGEHRVTARAAASRAAFSLGPALTVAALPVHAEPLQALAALDSQQALLPTTLLAEDGGIFGIVATVIVAGLGLFVLNFIKDAVFECAPASCAPPEGY